MLTASDKKIIRKRIEKTLELHQAKLSELDKLYRSMRKYNRDLEERMCDTEAALDSMLKEVQKNYEVFDKKIKAC